PWMVRRVYDEGHTVANHTQNHPIRKMSVDLATREIEEGFASLRTAIGDPQAVSPFFRIPGLLRQKSVAQYLAAHGDMTWSADFLSDDWTRTNNSEVARRAIGRIEARGRGIGAHCAKEYLAAMSGSPRTEIPQCNHLLPILFFGVLSFFASMRVMHIVRRKP